MAGLRGISDFGEMVGRYWADANAAFDKTNPSGLRRMARSFNPVTGLGSALGQFYSGVSNGDFVDAGLGAASAIPMMGYAKYAKDVPELSMSLIKQSMRQVRPKVVEQGVRGLGSDVATNYLSDKWEQYQNAR